MIRACLKISYFTFLAFSCSIYAQEHNLDNTSSDHNAIQIDHSSLNLDFLKSLNVKQLNIDARANQPVSVKDPFEPINRPIFVLNDTLDHYFLRPIAIQYDEIVPPDVQDSYMNFRSNLREPWNAVNQILQGKPIVAGKTLGRFFINTLSSLGFADTAKRRNLQLEKDDFGITLGVWGIPSGPYLMLPFFGPSTIRDAAGTIPDSYARPQRYFFDNDKTYWANYALDGVSTRAQLLSMEELLQGDRYSFIRDAYLQQRAYAVATKRGETFENSMFSDDPFAQDSLDESDDESENPPETTQ